MLTSHSSGIDRKNNISSRRFFQIVKEFTQLSQQLRSNILSRADFKNITSPISSQTDSINVIDNVYLPS